MYFMPPLRYRCTSPRDLPPGRGPAVARTARRVESHTQRLSLYNRGGASVETAAAVALARMAAAPLSHPPSSMDGRHGRFLPSPSLLGLRPFVLYEESMLVLRCCHLYQDPSARKVQTKVHPTMAVHWSGVFRAVSLCDNGISRRRLGARGALNRCDRSGKAFFRGRRQGYYPCMLSRRTM